MITAEGIDKPRRSTIDSCGYDIRLPCDVKLSRWRWKKIDLKLQMEPGDIPEGHFGLILPRSSTGGKRGMRMRNTGGVIDSDYTMDTIRATLKTDDWIPRTYHRGERVLQMIIIPYQTLPGEIAPTEARKGGRGSTGTS